MKAFRAYGTEKHVFNERDRQRGSALVIPTRGAARLEPGCFRASNSDYQIAPTGNFVYWVGDDVDA
jgi:hypothetical protein